MTHLALYDEDILLWSEQQAELIRRLGRTRGDLPNELDIDNIAEEIESVGRSELAAVESCLRLVMIHLIKIASVPGSPSVSHWRAEVLNFGADAVTRFAPSMAGQIDLARAWRLARRQAIGQLTAHGDAVRPLPERCPWEVDDLVREDLDLDSLLSSLAEGDGTSEWIS
jgi:hypothetical protein